MSIAQKILDVGDLETDAELDTVAVMRGSRPVIDDDRRRHKLPDGSVILMEPLGWSLGHWDCWCSVDDGHGEDCTNENFSRFVPPRMESPIS